MFRLVYVYWLLTSASSVNVYEENGCFEVQSLEDFYDLKSEAFSSELISGSVSNDNAFNSSISDKDALSKIYELAQFNNLPINYIVSNEEGPAHAKFFTIELHLEDEVFVGKGSNKKTAKRDAAIKALSQTSYKQPLYVKLKSTNVDTPAVQLNNVGLKLGLNIQYHLVEKIAGKDKKYISLDGNKINKTDFEYLKILKNQANYQPKGPFTVRVTVENKQYFGFSHSIQDARHEAAKRALISIDFDDNSCYREGRKSINCQIRKDQLKSPINKLNDIANYHKLSVEYDIIKEYGPDHNKHFITECKLSDIRVEGDGTSKKKSKKIAAENMLAKIENVGLKYLTEINENNKRSEKKSKKKKFSEDLYVEKIKEQWKSGDDVQKKSKDKPPKNKKIKITKLPKAELLEIGKMIGFQVEFTNLGEKNKKFHSVAFLGVDPWQICVGEGLTNEHAEAATALYALKYLYENIDFDKTILSENIKMLILNEKEWKYLLNTDIETVI